MSELKTVLGFEAAAAITTLTAMETALKSWTAAMQNAVTAAGTFNQAGKKTDGAVQRATAAARKHKDVITQTSREQGKTTQKVQQYANTIETAAKVQDSLVWNIKRTSIANKASVGSTEKAAKVQDSLVSNIQRTTAATRAAAESTVSADTKVTRSRKKVVTGSQSATQAVVAGAKKQEEAAKRVLLSWQSVVRIFAIQVIHQAVTKITTAMWEGVTAARDFEISLAEIQTIGVEFRNDFEGLAEQVRNFSDATGAPLEGVASGIYQTLSNQVADTSQAFEFMANTQAFATATMTTASDSVDLFSSVMNSYNLEISEAAKVGGKLAKIIDLGRIRGEEFANTFGRITVLASQLGITFDEVGASVATLTVTGLKYNEASTLMLNIMLKLIRPTEELSKRYTELGITSSEAGIQAFGFQGFLDKLAEKAGTSATELGKLFNRVRAIRGVMGLANKNALVYIDSLEAIKAAGAEELFEKRDIIFETNAKQVELELNRLRNVMVNDFGRGVTDALATVFDLFGGAVVTMKALGAATVGATIAVAVLKAEAIATALAFAAVHLPVTILVASAAVAAAALVTMYNTIANAAENARIEMVKQEELRLKVQLKNLDLTNETQKKRIREQLSDLQKYLFERKKLFDIAAKELLKVEEVIFDNITTQLGNKIRATTTFFNNLREQATNTGTVIGDLNNVISAVRLDIIDFNFERALRGLTPLQKANKQLERSAELRVKTTTALRFGEIELAEVMQDRAKSAALAALSAAEESENRNAIRKAERIVRNTFEDEITLLKKKKLLAIEEKDIIESAAEQIREQRTALKSLNNEILLTVKEFDQVRFDPVKREETIAKLKSLVQEAEVIFDTARFGFGLPSDSRIVADFRAVLGQDGEVNRLVAASLDRLNNSLAAITAPTTPVDRALQKQFPGAETVEELQAAVTEAGPLLETTIDTSKTRLTLEKEVIEALANQIPLIVKIHAAYNAATERAVIGERITTAALKRSQKIREEIPLAIHTQQIAARKLLEAAELDVAKFNELKESIVILGGGVRDENVRTAVIALIEGLDLIATKKQEIKQLELAALAQEEFEITIDRLNATHKAVGIEMTNAAEEGAKNVVLQEGIKQTAAKKTTEIFIKQQNALIRDAIVPVERRFGGLLYRAGGGFTPRGTDRIPAMLSPGEYVVNARSTRKFYSQLVAMNSGTQPVYRAEGGPVTNIGDVNITVNETVSAQQTARETMSAFRRQTRRGASTLQEK